MSDDLIEKAETALADGNGNAYLYAGLLRKAITEVKRLQAQAANWKEAAEVHHECRMAAAEQLSTKEAEITSWIADRDQWIARYEDASDELAKWRQIAIDERCKAIMLLEKLKDVANNPDWQTRGLSLTHDEYMRQAAKELDLQISQEAGYLDRLEKEFLDLYPYAEIGWSQHGYPIEFSEEERQEARDALDKIRAGGQP